MRVDDSKSTSLTMRLDVTSAPTARKREFNVCVGGTRERMAREGNACVAIGGPLHGTVVYLLPAKFEYTYTRYLNSKIRTGEHFIICLPYAYKSNPYTGLARPLGVQEVESPRI